jgi:hypothetical protein
MRPAGTADPDHHNEHAGCQHHDDSRGRHHAPPGPSTTGRCLRDPIVAARARAHGAVPGGAADPLVVARCGSRPAGEVNVAGLVLPAGLQRGLELWRGGTESSADDPASATPGSDEPCEQDAASRTQEISATTV